MTNNTKTHLHSAEMQCRQCRNTFANLVAQCWTPLSELLLESEDFTQELEPENTEWVSQFLAGCIVWDYWCIFTLGLGSFLRLLVYHTGAQCWKSFRIAAWKWKIHTRTWTWEQTISFTISCWVYCLRIDLMDTLGLGHSVASGFITLVHKLFFNKLTWGSDFSFKNNLEAKPLQHFL